MSLNLPDPMKAETEAAMLDPQVGDRFTEMFSFWVYVVGRGTHCVTTMSANPPCTFPEDAETRHQTLDDFRKWLGYNTIPGYWVRLVDRGNDVSWAAEVEA